MTEKAAEGCKGNVRKAEEKVSIKFSNLVVDEKYKLQCVGGEILLLE